VRNDGGGGGDRAQADTQAPPSRGRPASPCRCVSAARPIAASGLPPERLVYHATGWRSGFAEVSRPSCSGARSPWSDRVCG
jgi:hypothetical protein